MTWHADDRLLGRYVAAQLDAVASASVETHLVACPHCRAGLADLAVPTAQPRLDRVWDDLVDRLDVPAPSPVERALHRLGVREHTARLLAATPALHLSWLSAVAGLLAFAVAAAHLSPRGLFVFLAVAPLLPLAGVATAYGPGVDPTYEVGLAAPMRSVHLLLLRASAVLVTSSALAGLAALALPAVGWTAAAWLLPALALTLVTLALGGVVNPVWTCGCLGVGWSAAVLWVAAGRASHVALLGGAAQWGWAALAVLAALVLACRREDYEVGSRGRFPAP